MKNGSLRFDSAVQPRLRTFSEVNGEGRFFLGDYLNSGYEDDETWLMDHIRVEAHNGSVRIKFTEDNSDGSSEGKGKESGAKGFLSRLFG